MPLCTYWVRDGNEVRLETYPSSFLHWIPGETLNEPYRAALERVEAALSINARQMDVRGLDTSRSLVLDIEFADGARRIVRVLSDHPAPRDMKRARKRFECEVGVMRWLREHSSVPVPKIYNFGATFVAMERMPGERARALSRFISAPSTHLAAATQERAVLSYAEHALALFRLDVPQGRIGTLCPAGDALDVTPRAVIRESYCADKVYATLEDFAHALVEQRRRAAPLSPGASAAIDRVAALLPGACSRVAESPFRRSILVHEDLNETNVLVGAQGEVAGIVDWEFHSVLPAVLAAQYPRWIRYDGALDPRSGAGGTMAKYWLASPGDAARLRDAFAQYVKDRDAEYWRALVEGERLRQIVDWLSDPELEEWADCEP
ncbi:hypothetical protein BD309DRAFT_882618 [Dichomitus squalens]|nr:hypothetical protein BD309DRAFT_882618 [Dichomitus squalens]